MKTIKIRSQEEFDNLPEAFDELTEIHILCDLYKIKKNVVNGLYMVDNGTIQYVRGGTIQSVRGGTIQSVDGGTIQSVDGGTIQSVDGGTIQYVRGGTIQSVRGGTIQSVYGGTIQSVYGGTIQYVYGGTIQYVRGGTIQYVRGGTIQYVRGGTIQYVYGNSTVIAISDYSTIEHLYHNSTLICIGCKPKILKKQKSASVIYKDIFKHTKKSFLDIYPAADDGYVTLYKITDDNGFDHYTGKIKYEGTVNCPDWDKDRDRQCGGGLHLSPEPFLALQYNQGPIKKCKVHKRDFVVYPEDMTKVRCKKVEVICDVDRFGEEIKEAQK